MDKLIELVNDGWYIGLSRPSGLKMMVISICHLENIDLKYRWFVDSTLEQAINAIYDIVKGKVMNPEDLMEALDNLQKSCEELGQLKALRVNSAIDKMIEGKQIAIQNEKENILWDLGLPTEDMMSCKVWYSGK